MPRGEGLRGFLSHIISAADQRAFCN